MTLEAVRAAALDAGKREFGASWSPTAWSGAPGRLELLGNHIDYSGGLVLAGAIDRTVQIAIGTSGISGIIQVALDHGGDSAFSVRVDEVDDWHSPGEQATPSDYLTGIVAALQSRSIPIRRGAQLAIAGDVPIGFGMSSSAALCVASVLALADTRPPDREIVLIAQEAEHRAGSPVGAMDQSASVAGEVILFSGSNVSWQPLRPDLGPYVFAVANSGVSHALSASSYPVRVTEAQEILSSIQTQYDDQIPDLAAVTPEHFSDIEVADWLSDVLKRRLRHVVRESQRVAEGVLAVAQGDWHRFGSLMTASGQSSAGDYDISHPVVEELVSLLNKTPGVLGARMMGGGEGGPALALIDRSAIPQIQETLQAEFYAGRNMSNAFQICSFGAGATRD